MTAASAFGVLAVLAGGLFGQASRPAAPEPAVLAAGSFRRSAVGMTCSASTVPARAGRLVVLCRFAHRLDPGDWRTNRLLADLCLARADPNGEAGALEAYLQAFPGDHAQYLRWVTLRLAGLQTAERRAAFLESIVDRRGVSRPIRGELAAMLAGLRRGQGRTADALAMARRAVELDPYGPSGLAIWSALEGPFAAAKQLDLRLRLLRGDPRAAAEAWEIALQLGRLGLHEAAMRFFDHAWPDAEPSKAPAGNLSVQQLLVDYCNALLDAGRPAKAVQILVPAVERYTTEAELHALLHEAYRTAGKDAQARKLLDAMAKSYKDREASGEVSEAFAAEIAWFYVDFRPNPMSVIYARRAAEADPNNPVYQRILGAAEMGHTNPAKGEARLRKLLGKDVYASVLLAERYNRRADANSAARCRQAILAAGPLSRSGPAYRRLAALARRRNVALGPPKGAEEASRLLAGFDPNCLDMLRRPEKFLAVEIKPVRQTVACGEAVEVLATLRNLGPVAIPLGRKGLFRPEMALEAVVAGPGGEKIATVSRLPMAVWPAGRYLGPGQSCQQTVRLDVGELAAALAPRPLEDLSVEVAGTLDPSGGAGGSMPSVPVPKARIVRAGLLGAFDRSSPEAWPKAYALALGRIVRDLRRGRLSRRMRAARQTGSLLAMAGQIQAGRADTPRPLAGRIDRLVMLSMMRAVLADPSPAVRQEMIASLHGVPLDRTALSLLAPAIDDPSAMVRCRLVELLAVSQSKGHATIVQHLAGDKDELVRDMARLFLRP